MKNAQPSRGGYRNKDQLVSRFGLDRSKLPSPSAYHTNLGTDFKRNDSSGEWKTAYCPFCFSDEPVLRINLVHGCFKCPICGVKGRDVIAFEQQLKKLTFINACKSLGAWNELGVKL